MNPARMEQVRACTAAEGENAPEIHRLLPQGHQRAGDDAHWGRGAVIISHEVHGFHRLNKQPLRGGRRGALRPGAPSSVSATPAGSPGVSPTALPSLSPPTLSRRSPRGDLLLRAPDDSVSHWMAAGTYHLVPKDAPWPAQRWGTWNGGSRPVSPTKNWTSCTGRPVASMRRRTTPSLAGSAGASLRMPSLPVAGYNGWRTLKRNLPFAAALV